MPRQNWMAAQCWLLSARRIASTLGRLPPCRKSNGSGWFNLHGAFTTCRVLCHKEIRDSSETRKLSSGTVSQTPDLNNFATARGSSRLSKVELCWSHLRRSTRRARSTAYRAMLCTWGTSHGPVSVSVCVHLSQIGVLSKRLNRSSWFLACELPSTRPTLC